LSEAEPGPYDKIGYFRAEERAKMLATMSELIEEARRKATSRNTRSRDRPKWTNLAGKLIWYRDQILRSMNYEALQKEMEELRQIVNKRLKLKGQENLKKPPLTPLSGNEKALP
jgi:hypothetical protein